MFFVIVVVVWLFVLLPVYFFFFFFETDSYSLDIDGCPGRGSCRDMQKGHQRALAENEHLIRD